MPNTFFLSSQCHFEPGPFEGSLLLAKSKPTRIEYVSKYRNYIGTFDWVTIFFLTSTGLVS